MLALLYGVFLTKDLILLATHEKNTTENTIQQACRRQAGKKGDDNMSYTGQCLRSHRHIPHVGTRESFSIWSEPSDYIMGTLG